MRMRILLAFLIVLSLATLATAQTKISGTVQCAKPDAHYAVEVGDRPNHSFMIEQFKCTWTKPMEIEGVQNKEGMGTDFHEISGNSSRFRGIYMDTMANGDKAQYRYEGTATLKDGVPQSAEDKWKFVSGSGKLKAIKSHGTCKGAAGADGSVTWECVGEYEVTK